MRRAASSPSVSLFPFLAVLLCAMGALIFLLIVLTRQIRDNAVAVHAPNPPMLSIVPRPTIAELPPSFITSAPVKLDLPPEVERLPILIPPPPQPEPEDPNIALRQQLADQRTRQQDLAAQLARLQRQVDDAEARLRAEQQALSDVSIEADANRQRLAVRASEAEQRSASVAQLRTAVEEAQRRLQQAKLAAASAEPKVSILPYEGISGTARRPILIECRGDEIIFLPEGIALRPVDLDGFLPTFNPLLAGSEALRNYWSGVDGPNNPKPYVLLLVRPDGAAAYYAARTLLTSAGADTGYELIPASLELSLPTKDPQAERACRNAVDELLRARAEILARVAAGGTIERAKAYRAGDDDSFLGDVRQQDPFGGADSATDPDAPLKRPRSFNVIGGTSVAAGHGFNVVGAPPISRSENRTASRRSDEPPVPPPTRRVGEISTQPLGGSPPNGSPLNGSTTPAGSIANQTRGGVWPRSEPGSGADRSGYAGSTSQPPVEPLDPAARFAERAGRNGQLSPTDPSQAFPREYTSYSPERNPFDSDARSSGREPGSSAQQQRALYRKSNKPARFGSQSLTAFIALQKPLLGEVTETEIRVGSQPPVPIGPLGVTDSTAQAVMSAVEQEVGTWGDPPHDFYWSPRLDMTIYPGSTRHFDLLSDHLKSYGLPSKSRVRLERPAPEAEYEHASPTS